ncbi:hypothetical protein JMJ35_010471 [Cladonia borealis]|uniref:Uncharacterized protein n=1 Tax=Cladonia borealis TaxID=184061 RepID=A0AA39UX15_9LECA|nr:hypothetical protein JMJ35_010471 [Cladonia borealis]
MSYSPVNQVGSASTGDPPQKQTIARISLNPRAHKLAIAFQISTIFLTSCVIPLVLYYALIYKTSLKLQIILAIVTPIFGVVSLSSLFLRTWRLLSARKYLPLGQKSRWALDYFDWNFALGFIVVAVVIAAGISMKPSNVRMVALSLPMLMLQICSQMVLLVPLSAMHVRAPFRFSSIGKGELLKPAVYVIVEDVIAVDAKQGDVFRSQWRARYESSQPFRNLLTQLDLLWGVSGVLVAGGIIAVLFAVKPIDVGWAVGWGVPWIWTAVMSLITFKLVDSMDRKEDALVRNGA